MAPHAGGFNRGEDPLAKSKAAPALLSEHFAPQFRLKQRLYSDDFTVVVTLRSVPGITLVCFQPFSGI
jgi:hypothetical protein